MIGRGRCLERRRADIGDGRYCSLIAKRRDLAPQVWIFALSNRDRQPNLIPIRRTADISWVSQVNRANPALRGVTKFLRVRPVAWHPLDNWRARPEEPTKLTVTRLTPALIRINNQSIRINDGICGGWP